MKELQQNCQKHNDHEDMQTETQVASLGATYLLLSKHLIGSSIK